MQIKGEEFIKKVQIQQEREELERKLNELEEVEMSINTDSVILERNNNIEQNEHELDNIMLGSSNYSNEDNKKKYLILGIVLVVLFLLTIIIIRLLTNDSAVKEDQFTSNSANSTEMKKLSESDNIEENFQKIINERVKKDTNEPIVPEVQGHTPNNTRPETNTKSEYGNGSPAFENLQKEAENYNSNSTGISDEAIDQTIKKVERSKSVAQKEKVTTTTTSTPKEEVVTKKVETKKSSIKDLVDTPSNTTTASSEISSNVSSGYFIQIGAFTKKPTDGYVSTIRNAKFKYKIYDDNNKMILLWLIILFSLLMAKFGHYYNYFITPITAGALLIAILITPRIALISSIVVAFLVGMGIEYDSRVIAFVLLSSLIGVYTVVRTSHGYSLLKTGLIISIANVIVIASTGLIAQINYQELMLEMLLGALSGVLSAVITTGILPYFEYSFKNGIPKS